MTPTVLALLVDDARFACRAILRHPMLAAVIVVSLGVGIGVNTAVFSWVEALVLRPIPGVREPSRFILLEPRTDTGSYPGASWLEYQDFGRLMRTAVDPIAFRMTPVNVGDGVQTSRTFALLVSGNYFSALGLEAYRGRLISGTDAARPGGEPVAVISVRLLAVTLRRGRRRWPPCPGERPGADDRRHRPAAVPGDGPGAEFRPVDARDARAGHHGNVERAARSIAARLHRHDGAPTGRSTRARAGRSGKRDAAARGYVRRNRGADAGRRAAVLAVSARSPADACRRRRHPPGSDAAAARCGVRQHSEPAPGARYCPAA